MHPWLCIRVCVRCVVTQRTDNPWPELHGSQNYRWDKSCVNIWNKVRTQRDRFLLVWVPRRTVRRKGFIGITFERWWTVVSGLETARLTTLFCTHIGSLCIFQHPKQCIYLVVEELKGENPLHLQINFRSLISGDSGRKEEHFSTAFSVLSLYSLFQLVNPNGRRFSKSSEVRTEFLIDGHLRSLLTFSSEF